MGLCGPLVFPQGKVTEIASASVDLHLPEVGRHIGILLADALEFRGADRKRLQDSRSNPSGLNLVLYNFTRELWI
jgi:hypothetical protein